MKFKHGVFLLLGVGMVFVYVSLDPNKADFMPKCPFYALTGIYCPGCGSQRATHQLLNFNIVGVLQQNVLYFISLLVIIYHLTIRGFNLFYKKNIYNYIYHPKTPKYVLIVIVSFWILRNIPTYPFHLFAPK